jgi:cobaltochelatase CobN
MWGETAPEAYEESIQGTEVVLRTWVDPVASPLANKCTWWLGGSLSLVVKYLTGKEPDFILSDVRDIDKAKMITAEDWQEVVNVYVRDSKALHIREWFDQENPYAFQGMTQVLLETIRKGYWTPEEATVREIATAHAKSVIRYGKNNGLRGGGNVPFQEFIQSVLNVPGDQKAQALVEEYKAARKTAETVPADKTTASPAPDSATIAADRNNGTKAKEQNPQTPPKPATPPEGESKQVSGEKLEPAPASERRPHALWLAAGLIFLGLLVYGFVRRKGSIR